MGAGPQARSPQLLMIDRHAGRRPAHLDSPPDHRHPKAIRDFAIMASVDLDASDAAGQPVFRTASFAPASIASETSDRSELSSAMSGLRVCGDIPGRLIFPSCTPARCAGISVSERGTRVCRWR